MGQARFLINRAQKVFFPDGEDKPIRIPSASPDGDGEGLLAVAERNTDNHYHGDYYGNRCVDILSPGGRCNELGGELTARDPLITPR
jgi:hypothetical protein